MFNINDWYWFVGSDISKVFSSKVMDFVKADDAAYQAWITAGYETSSAGAASQDELVSDIKKQQIVALEAKITPRRSREVLLGNANSIAFIQDLDKQIETLRVKI